MAKRQRKYNVLLSRPAYVRVEIEATSKAEACMLAVNRAYQIAEEKGYSCWGGFRARDLQEIK
ncbi:hypothetical protein E5358_12675 [Palleniella muris]|uniref:Uncharacterized protein n=1 Tax=Palleniella muris TaxID=3038145 RepID=A0AC61QMB3_9BACT|nr:hypothetical protein [Palleniella muris]TGX80505.1 hypothetical protein E5358_12675 [Palleniella muris]